MALPTGYMKASGRASDGDGRQLVLVAGGQADTLSTAAQTAAAPAFDTLIAQIATPGAGVYRVTCTAMQTGTVDGTSVANVYLKRGATSVGRIPSSGTPVPVVLERVTVGAGESIQLLTFSTFAAGAVVVGTLQATRIE